MTPAQTPRKTFDLLRLLAAAGEKGASLAALHERSGLPKPTLHRLLAALCEEGLAIRTAAGRCYVLGPEVFALALQARSGTDLVAQWRPALLRIVEQTGDSAFLMARSGFDAVCLAREDGMIQIRTLTNSVGGRVPLGIGQGSAAILAGLPDSEADALLRHNHARLCGFDAAAPQAARDALAQMRAQGYAHGGGHLLADVAGVAVPVPPRLGVADCALSVASLRARLDGARLAEVVAVMRAAIAETASGLIG